MRAITLVTLSTATLLLVPAFARADTFQDNYQIALDPSQIDAVPGGENWHVEGLPTSGDLLLEDDDWIANIEFTGGEFLRCMNLDSIAWTMRAVSAGQYSVNWQYWGQTSGGDQLFLFGTTTSDFSGQAGGSFEVNPAIAQIDLTGLRLRLFLSNGNTVFDNFDISFVADDVAILPEPRGLLLASLGALLVLRRS